MVETQDTLSHVRTELDIRKVGVAEPTPPTVILSTQPHPSPSAPNPPSPIKPPSPPKALQPSSFPCNTHPHFRRPPSLRSCTVQTALIFPPYEAHNTYLLPYLPSSLILPARVSSTTLAHTTHLHIRSNLLLIHSPTFGPFHAVLPLPPHPITATGGTISITSFNKKPLHIRPPPGAVGPLLEALRPPRPPLITVLRRVSEKVFLARMKGKKVAVKLFPEGDLPEYAFSTRVGLQRARGVGVVPLLCAMQGRGFAGLVMPVGVDLGMYIEKFGRLKEWDARGVMRELVTGLCRVNGIGAEVGAFDKGHVLIDSRGRVGISVVRYANVMHEKEVETCAEGKVSWKDTLESLVHVIRECCEVSATGEDFLRGCERNWSPGEMTQHRWVKDSPTPQLRMLRVKGVKDIGETPRRIASGIQTVLGWEFVHR